MFGEGIPRGVVSDHGVKEGEEFTHAGDECNLAGLAGSEEMLVEALIGGLWVLALIVAM